MADLEKGKFYEAVSAQDLGSAGGLTHDANLLECDKILILPGMTGADGVGGQAGDPVKIESGGGVWYGVLPAIFPWNNPVEFIVTTGDCSVFGFTPGTGNYTIVNGGYQACIYNSLEGIGLIQDGFGIPWNPGVLTSKPNPS